MDAMEKKTIVDDRGRKQDANTEGDLVIPVGPPLGVVDILDLPEPFATNLHNALYQRGLINYAAVAKNPNALRGALQDVLMLDVQKLTEAFYLYENTPPLEVYNAR